MAIDPTTSLGKVRLRIGDWADIPVLPDSVITGALSDNGNNVPAASAICAQYILGILSSGTHRKMGQLETWGAERFSNYLSFLKSTILNPNFMDIAPVPYANVSGSHPLIDFVNEWNEEYSEYQIVHGEPDA